MPKVQLSHKTVTTPLDKFLGPDAAILTGNEIPVNNNVRAQRFEVSFEGAELPDEQGRLFVFPVDEGRYSLQLCYLIYADDTQQHVTAYSIVFLPAFFDQFDTTLLTTAHPFNLNRAEELQFFICARAMTVLTGLGQSHGHTQLARAFNDSQSVIILLNRALESIAVPFTVCQVPACRFLAYDSERDKITDAVALIEQQTGKPYTIKDLARKVAMNECYLKKGFKTITGKTIHEYQQELRINRAKDLLQNQGYSVTSAAFELGYSSIAHFSTAFKRVTGMKPCELLG